ncbi:MAG: hypothetical protein RMJ43_14445 [Chloroherpetonaceae bacterium]|nr:hypothetical protein [Chthonomonadaceae bacterium]MDW8209031.1 hypothetical protein [Chloroherpetonaceae bacterium]
MTTHHPFDPGEDLVRGPEHTREEDHLWVLLNAYCDGEASEAEVFTVEQALCSDARYARDLNFLRVLSGHVQAVPEVDPPASLRASILRATTQRVTFERRLLAGMEALQALWVRPASRIAVPAGAIAATLLLAALWPHQSEQIAEPPAVTPPVAMERTRAGQSDPVSVGKPVARATVATGASVRSSNPAGPAAVAKSLSSARVVTTQVQQQRERRKREFVERPQVREPDINVVLLTENGRPVRQPVRPRLAFKPVRPRTTLLQDTNTPGEPRVTPVGYTYAPRPMMEREYQRRVESGVVPENHAEPLALPDVVPGDSVATRDGSRDITETSGTAGTGNPVVASNNNAPTAEASTVPRTTIFRSNRPMPIFTRRYVSGADLKRERDAAMLGYTRSAVLSIERTELTGNVVGRF